MKYWKKYSHQERLNKVAEALAENVNFAQDISLGFPASKLDGKVFYDNAPFLKEAPTLQTFVANPNHIGCHTLGQSESVFSGTQQLEKEVLNALAIDVFQAKPEGFDGYISPGGTEANIQALWMYRNYFLHEHQASLKEIAIVSSEDTHYSIPKGANLLQVDWLKIPVDFSTRQLDKKALQSILIQAKENGKNTV